MRKKIAFVTVRYGLEINGGAEFHCRMLAERLAADYEVEVLTTCVKDYVTGENIYQPGTEKAGGVTVRRFRTCGFSQKDSSPWMRKAKPGRRLRMFLYNIGLLRPLSYIIKSWNWKLEEDIDYQKHSVFYSEDMVDYISARKDEYDAFIAVTADFAPFYFTAMTAGEKMIAIPTMHYAKVSFRVSLAQAFRHIRYTGFNTTAEQKLAKGIFGPAIRESSVISVGIEVPEPADWEQTRSAYRLPDRYILYIGRVDRCKTGDMISYYTAYRRKYGSAALPLVVIGNIFREEEKADGVLYTGFVSDPQKRAILQHAELLLNPSRYESLSLVLLEALNDRIPTLVNGHCNVLREHCRKSGGAVQAYTGKGSFVRQLHRITSDGPLRNMMKDKGKEYMEKNYSWDIILPRLHKAIDIVTDATPNLK